MNELIEFESRSLIYTFHPISLLILPNSNLVLSQLITVNDDNNSSKRIEGIDPVFFSTIQEPKKSYMSSKQRGADGLKKIQYRKKVSRGKKFNKSIPKNVFKNTHESLQDDIKDFRKSYTGRFLNFKIDKYSQFFRFFIFSFFKILLKKENKNYQLFF